RTRAAARRMQRRTLQARVRLPGEHAPERVLRKIEPDRGVVQVPLGIECLSRIAECIKRPFAAGNLRNRDPAGGQPRIAEVSAAVEREVDASVVSGEAGVVLTYDHV